MASDFSKLIEHPEREKIIAKLVSGDPPKTVAEYLKAKYDEEGQAHLRLGVSLLKEFKDKYLDKYKFLDKLIKDEQAGKLDKKIAESLMQNKTWRERLEEAAGKTIDLKKRIQEMIFMIESRAEQVFDLIQQNPQGFKGDFVLIKYFESLINIMEKADKIINERPDTLIQNNISINMIEQHSVAMQEAIRATLSEMDPEFSAMFMDKLAENMRKLKPEEPLNIEQKMEETDRIIARLPAEFTLEATGE